jgi:hypothetical protein
MVSIPLARNRLAISLPACMFSIGFSVGLSIGSD